VGPTVDLFGFPAQVNTVTAEKLQMCTASYIYRIRPLGSAGCVIYIYRIRPLKVNMINKPAGSNNQYLSDKIMILYFAG